jgi:hypothetical protein
MPIPRSVQRSIESDIDPAARQALKARVCLPPLGRRPVIFVFTADVPYLNMPTASVLPITVDRQESDQTPEIGKPIGAKNEHHAVRLRRTPWLDSPALLVKQGQSQAAQPLSASRQAARTRARRRSKIARPYIRRLILLSRFTGPSTGLLLQSSSGSAWQDGSRQVNGVGLAAGPTSVRENRAGRADNRVAAVGRTTIYLVLNRITAPVNVVA